MKTPEKQIPALKEIIEERKGKTIEKLSATYAENKLPLEEYERLVEYMNKIESERELVVVEKIVAEYDGDNNNSSPADYNDDYNPPDAGYRHYNNSYSNLTVLSTRVFSGPIKSGTQSVSILGSQRIDIKKADLEKKQTVLNIVSILGDSEICVEGGIRVINRAIPILGNAEMNQKVSKQERSGDPELIISGTAILGNISIKLLKE